MNEYEWNVSFDIVRVFPLYQSSIGYNSDRTAIIITKIHPQAITDNSKHVKKVQSKLTNDTSRRQQKLLFCKIVRTRVKSSLSVVILVKITLNATRPSVSKLVKARVILLQSIVTFVKTTSNATRPASATIKMGVLLSLGQSAPMSEPMFAPDAKEKMHSNDQQGISKRVEEDKTRETSKNTNIVKILRVDIIKLVPLLEDYTVLIDGNYSSDNAMDAQHGEYNNGDLENNWSDTLDISSVNIKSSLLLMYPSKMTSIRFNIDSSLQMYPSNNKEYQRDCSIQWSHQIARKDAIMILNKNTKQGYHFTSTLMYDSHSSTIAYTSDNGFRECYDFLKMHSFCKYQQTKHIETMVDSIPDSDRGSCLRYQYIPNWIQQPSYFKYTFLIL